MGDNIPLLSSNSSEQSDPTAVTSSPPVPPSRMNNTKPPNTGAGRKRPFPFKRQTGKRAKATFEKKEVTKLASTNAILTAWEIETSYRGIFDLCHVLFAILVNRDSKIANLISEYHLIYVLLLSSIYRSRLVASKSTTTIVRQLSHLKETIHDLLLPDILCQYVESIGYYKLSTTATIIPYSRDYPRMKDSIDFIDPVSILARMNREDPGTDWAIDDHVILEYKQAISRFLKNALHLRKVDNTVLEAKPEFIAVSEVLGDGRVRPLAFEEMQVDQCTLGAVYRFRDHTHVDDWDGNFRSAIVHEAQAVVPVSYLTDMILHHLKGDQ